MSSDFSIRDSLAVWTGLEPATPCVTGRYSNQLNYHTVGHLDFSIASAKVMLLSEFASFLRNIFALFC